MKKSYTMTQAQFDKLIDACKPVPMIMLQCGTQRSQQERANDAWKELGDELGFDHMTVQPNGLNQLDFLAMPK